MEGRLVVGVKKFPDHKVAWFYFIFCDLAIAGSRPVKVLNNSSSTSQSNWTAWTIQCGSETSAGTL